MDASAHQLIKHIEDLKAKLKLAEQHLKQIQATCNHDWPTPQYDPIIRPAYRVPEVRQGSDFRPAYTVPEQRDPRWRRVCLKCGLVQETVSTIEQVQKRLTPKFPSR